MISADDCFLDSFVDTMVDKNVMNNYIPPDFDPNKLLPMRVMRPKRKAGPHEMSIRMMMPFSMRCSQCGDYMHIATKFNSRCSKISQNSLGLDIYRFYGHCKHCNAEFSFRTDPDNSDYILESGGSRTYEAFKDADFAEAEIAKQKADADEGEAIDYKIYDTAEEMRKLDELDQLRSLSKQRGALQYSVVNSAMNNLFKAEDDSKRVREDDEDIDEYRRAIGTAADDDSEVVTHEKVCLPIKQSHVTRTSLLTGYSSSSD